MFNMVTLEKRVQLGQNLDSGTLPCVMALQGRSTRIETGPTIT